MVEGLGLSFSRHLKLLARPPENHLSLKRQLTLNALQSGRTWKRMGSEPRRIDTTCQSARTDPYTSDFRGMVKLMKDYIALRRRWGDLNILVDTTIPPTPSVTADDPLAITSPALRFRAAFRTNSTLKFSFQWRLAEVALGRATKPIVPNHYEIQSLWEATGTSTVTIPTKKLKPGRTYRARSRACDPNGRCSHWSEPVQFGT